MTQDKPEDVNYPVSNHLVANLDRPTSAFPASILLPGWQSRLAAVEQKQASQPPIQVVVPRSPAYHAERLSRVVDADDAMAMLDFARQRPLAFIGLDTEFQYDRPGVPLKKNRTAYDPRSIRPLLMSLALAEPDGHGTITMYRFVLDLRVPEVLPALTELLRQHVVFVGHYLQAELMCLYQLGLPEPDRVWDTWVHEKALYLGRNHEKYNIKPEAEEAEQIRAAEHTEQENEFTYKLTSTSLRYGVTYPYAGDKERLQASFLNHPLGAPFTDEQVEYAAADAVAAAALYLPQVTAAAQAGILQHLTTVEMPWVITNARMVRRGVRQNSELCHRVEQTASIHKQKLQADLANQGIANARSHLQLEAFFETRGLLHLFQRNGKISFDKNMLQEFNDHHPVIPMLLSNRKIDSLLTSRILTDELVGADGRIHANHTQLGTHTGRQTSWGPNILGLGRVFRPLIVPEPGYGLGEVDLSQIEVGIAAAFYNDERLVNMFNTGDVYSAMAQYCYRQDLSAEDCSMPTTEFKKKYKTLREKMKTCTLGIIYGLKAHGIALRLRIAEREAFALVERFMGMFPALRQALTETPVYGGLCGYVGTVSGLRRHRARRIGSLTTWERNWMTNHPVQGSAAVVFKVAGNRLDRLYRRHGAWLLVPLHDAYLFETPLEVLREVADLTGRVLCESVQEYFPTLKPRVEVNIVEPRCWNKDGQADSVERWLDDPLFCL
jgi:DNA polymerase-1